MLPKRTDSSVNTSSAIICFPARIGL